VKEFEVKTLGKLKYFLAIEATHSEIGIFISQQKYIPEIDNTTYRPANTPIDPNTKLGSTKKNVVVDKEKYHKLDDKLIYLISH